MPFKVKTKMEQRVEPAGRQVYLRMVNWKVYRYRIM